MNNQIVWLTQQLHEHQQARPEEPNDNFPWWYHDRYEEWQRKDQALRLLLGAQLVERELANKEDE